MTILRTPQIENIIEHVEHESLRCAIEFVETLNIRILRVGLFGTLLYRPDPAVPKDTTQRTSHMSILGEEVEVIGMVTATLKNAAPLPDTPKIVVDWIAGIAASRPQALAQIERIELLSRDLFIAARDETAAQAQALANYMQSIRSGFFDAVTIMCEALWADLTAQHDAALERATAAATSLGDRLSRLERIGKHVRLVSLNASVEAARAGDVGKGLMVIANEFKTLAEEIQTLAKDSRDDVARIS